MLHKQHMGLFKGIKCKVKFENGIQRVDWGCSFGRSQKENPGDVAKTNTYVTIGARSVYLLPPPLHNINMYHMLYPYT